MPLYGRRRALEPGDFHKRSLASHARGDEIAHCLTYLIVVGSHVRRIFLAVGLAVKEYYRDALVVRAVYHSRQGSRLVGCHDEQVYPFVDKMLYLTDLQAVIIVGRGKFQPHVAIGIASGFELLILFVTPYVLATLRYADMPSPRLIGASTHQSCPQRTNKTVFYIHNGFQYGFIMV